MITYWTLLIIISIIYLIITNLKYSMRRKAIFVSMISYTLIVLMNFRSSRALFRQLAYDDKIFLALDLINKEDPFENREVLELMYILMNHAICDDLRKLFDIMTIKENNSKILDILQAHKDSKLWSCIKYITIRYDYLITIIIKILYNFAGIQLHIKILFLTLLDEFIKHSSLNAIACGKVNSYLIKMFNIIN